MQLFTGATLILLLALGAGAHREAAHTKSIDNVIQILLGMTQSFQQMDTTDRANWDTYLTQSEQQEKDKNDYVATQRQIALSKSAFQAANEQESAQLVKDLAAIATEVGDTTRSLGELKSLRDSEHSQHTAQLTDLTDTIRSVNQAIEILEGHYAASGNALAEIKKRVQYALSLAAATKQVTMVTTFIQKEPDWLSKDGASAYGSYSGQGGASGVIGTLQELRSALETEKQSSIETENENRRQYEATKGAKDESLARLNKEGSDKTIRKGECEAAIVSARAAVDTATGLVGEGEAFLQVLLADRSKFQSEFDTRIRTRADEAAATQAALDALQAVSSGGAAAAFLQQLEKPLAKKKTFLQLSKTSTTRCPKCLNQYSKLLKLGEKLHSAALIQAATQFQVAGLASKAAQKMVYSPEAMEPVKGLLQDLINRLTEEQNAESGHNEWCETEKNSGVAAKSEREGLIQAKTTAIEQATTSVAQLKTEILFLQSEMQRVTQETQAAQTLRTSEHNAFVTAKEDHDQVIKALQTAIGALGGQSFSLIQGKKVGLMKAVAKGKGKESPFGDFGSQSGEAGSAVEMLQDLETRYTSARTQLVEDENSAQGAFDALSTRNTQFLTDTGNTKNAKIAERRGKIQQLANDKADMKSNMKELTEVTQYLQDLRPSCDDIRSTFEERKRRREAEIDALKEAVAVLSDPSTMR